MATEITTLNELWDIRSALSGDYVLMNDIDLVETKDTGRVNWDAGTNYVVGDYVNYFAVVFVCLQNNFGNIPPISPTYWKLLWSLNTGWTAIGATAAPFTGTFDGNNFTISNLYINKTTTFYEGLFGYCSSTSKFYNIKLENAEVTGKYGTGSLFGYTSAAETINCHTINSIVTITATSGSSAVGGFAGIFAGPAQIIYNCSAKNVTVSANYYQVGGFAGQINTATGYITMYDCFVSGGNSIGTSRVGGFAGVINHNSTNQTSVTNCFAHNITVLGTGTGAYNSTSDGSQTGGFCGRQNYSLVENCYSTCAVSASSPPVGYDASGFLGFSNLATVTSCYWDTQTSGKATSILGTGKTTAEMQTKSTFVDWDFVDIWGIDSHVNSGYPYFLGDDSYIFYLLGGSNQNADNLDIVEYINCKNQNIVYNNSNEMDDTSILLEKMPIPKHGSSVVYSDRDGNIYVIGGFTTAQNNKYIDIGFDI